MRFEWPWALSALLLVPAALAGFLVLERRRARYAIRYTNVEVLATVSGIAARRRWRAYVPAALVLLALTCAVSALARPERDVALMHEQTSIVLAVDTSGSMAAADVKPTRLAAAQEAIRRFLAEVPAKYRVGLVTFSGAPSVVAPLSWNRDVVWQALQGIEPHEGTAIGDALARAVELLGPMPTTGSPVDGAPAAILLLSDGAQTRGRLTPLAGARRAKTDGIPVYTIALGTPDGRVQQGVLSLPVPPDAPTLRRIARTTGGEFFAPEDQVHLDAVYDHLASRLGRTSAWREIGSVLSGLAAVFALGAGAVSLRGNARLP